MLIDKLLDYVTYETTSDENSTNSPSTVGQIVLGKHLLKQLEDLGLKDCAQDEYGYVYAYLDGDESLPTIGLIAHMDTSDQASGKDVKPRIIENYDGQDIKLNDNLYTTVSKFPILKKCIGKTLVVTDGTTLLGADDKAGIAIIMEVLETLINNPELKHGPIRVCFTPDEEIGIGTIHFNYDLFKVDFAYTVDGDDPNNLEYENFNGASANVEFKGVSVHPGSAKNIMVNANKLLFEFDSMLDPQMVPELTEGYEGFNLCVYMEGEVAKAKANYILRNFNYDLLSKQKESFLEIAKKMNEKYGYDAVKVEIKDMYHNMKEYFNDNMYPIDIAKTAMSNLNMEFESIPIRGGTDGATLTANGVLCPNIGTGGHNFHGEHEFWCKQDGQKAVELILEILKIAKK